jgi:hypothetical protein
MNETEGWVAGLCGFFLLVALIFTQGVRCNRDDNTMRIKEAENLRSLKVTCVQSGRTPVECNLLTLP